MSAVDGIVHADRDTDARFGRAIDRLSSRYIERAKFEDISDQIGGDYSRRRGAR